MTPTRTEVLAIVMKLNAEAVPAHADDAKFILKHCGGNPSTVDEAFLGEVINLHYRFSASYFGRVEEVLRAVGRILDDSTVVVDVQLDELKHGECLIQTILLQIQEIRKKLSKQ